jgi:hypothetical protein
VQLRGTFHQMEAPSKLFLERLRVMSHHVESTAVVGIRGAEGADDDESDVSNISKPLRMTQPVKPRTRT